MREITLQLEVEGHFNFSSPFQWDDDNSESHIFGQAEEGVEYKSREEMAQGCTREYIRGVMFLRFHSGPGSEC